MGSVTTLIFVMPETRNSSTTLANAPNATVLSQRRNTASCCGSFMRAGILLPVNIHQLGKRISARMKDPQHDAVFLRCDRTVAFGAFAKVVDELRVSGIANISVVTEPISSGPSTQ